MRILTSLAAAIAALLDAIFGLFRDPVDAVDMQTAAFEAETERVLAKPDADPVDVVREAALGEHVRGYLGLPSYARAWAACAHAAGVRLHGASDSEVRRWSAGEAEHPDVPRHWVERARRGIVGGPTNEAVEPDHGIAAPVPAFG